MYYRKMPFLSLINAVKLVYSTKFTRFHLNANWKFITLIREALKTNAITNKRFVGILWLRCVTYSFSSILLMFKHHYFSFCWHHSLVIHKVSNGPACNTFDSVWCPLEKSALFTTHESCLLWGSDSQWWSINTHSDDQ